MTPLHRAPREVYRVYGEDQLSDDGTWLGAQEPESSGPLVGDGPAQGPAGASEGHRRRMTGWQEGPRRKMVAGLGTGATVGLLVGLLIVHGGSATPAGSHALGDAPSRPRSYAGSVGLTQSATQARPEHLIRRAPLAGSSMLPTPATVDRAGGDPERSASRGAPAGDASAAQGGSEAREAPGSTPQSADDGPDLEFDFER